MHTLTAWAIRHRIPPTAMADLLHTLGLSAPPHPAPRSGPMSSEAAIQQEMRLEAARQGGRLFRNNSGVAKDDSGRMVRFGLANDSAQFNKICKSSDLIGITPVVCGCGQRYGVFTGIECKSPGWKLRPSDARGQAQWNFGKLVISLGGIFRFVTGQEG
jgi:hypothetical protein